MNTEEANMIEAEDVATTPSPTDGDAVEAQIEEAGSGPAVDEPDTAGDAVTAEGGDNEAGDNASDSDVAADAAADAEVEPAGAEAGETESSDPGVSESVSSDDEAVEAGAVESTAVDSVDVQPAVEAGAVESAAADSVDVQPAVEAGSDEAVDESVSSDETEEDEGPDRSNMNWYVVHTYSGYENRAKQCLLDRITSNEFEDMFGDILIPVENVVEMKKGTKRTSTRKFFPGYMLVQMEMSNETWHLVKGTQKITGFVGGTAGKPKPVPMREVKRITDQMVDGAERPKPKQTFEEGAQVRVTDGPFLNFTGTVEEVRPDKQKLRVLVSIFGRATPLELDFIQVERM